jgi:DNA-binding NarL/FixJ family response regulator
MLMESLTPTVPPRLVNTRGGTLLSKRKDKIVRLVAQGASNREIASRLGLSPHTVRNYLFKIFDRLDVSSRVELVLYAMYNATPNPAAGTDELAS